MSNRNKGYIKITRGFLERANVPQAFYLMEFTPINVRENIYQNVYEYVGLSPKFREVKDQELIPEYNPVFRKLESGEVILESLEEVK